MYRIKFVSLLLETSWHTYCTRAVDGRTDTQMDTTKPVVAVRNFTRIAKKICCLP